MGSQLKQPDIDKLATLARLRVSVDEIEALTGDLNAILEHVNNLQELELPSDVEASSPTVTSLREDCVQPSLDPTESLANAPEPIAGGFGVPKVID
jgi:aspartyl-tRNA(Asn)/glutamyl-tRNA(Gln) amidotransferase subunit C